MLTKHQIQKYRSLSYSPLGSSKSTVSKITTTTEGTASNNSEQLSSLRPSQVATCLFLWLGGKNLRINGDQNELKIVCLDKSKLLLSSWNRQITQLCSLLSLMLSAPRVGKAAVSALHHSATCPSAPPLSASHSIEQGLCHFSLTWDSFLCPLTLVCVYSLSTNQSKHFGK